MKKVLLGIVVILVLVIGVGGYYLLTNLDSLVKQAIETYGSQATQTAVKVNSVKIDLTDGAGAIHGLAVGNPRGYKAADAFSLGEISTRVNLKSLAEEVIVIDHITVRGPEVYFEINAQGDNNLSAIRKNLSPGAAKSSTTSSTAQGGGADPKLTIRKVLFENGIINANVVPVNRNYELKLPKLEMTDLGGRGGATPKQIAEQIVAKLSEQALAEVKRQGIDRYKEQVEGEVNKKLEAEEEKVRQKIGGETTDALKGLLKGK